MRKPVRFLAFNPNFTTTFHLSGQHRGNYLLEFAAVLTVLLPLLLGAVDINSAFQGYTAVRAGTTTAARCVFPTDAACVQSAAFTPPTAHYDWYRGTAQQHYFVRYDNYSGTGYWLMSPHYTWNSYQAQVYIAASYDLQQQEYQAFDQQIAISQPLEIATQLASLPRVTGTDPEYPTGYVYRANQNVAYDGALPVAVQNAVVKAGVTGIIEITPPAWASATSFASLACFKVAGFDAHGDATPNVNVPCDRQAGTSATFPIAFRIAGKARNGTVGLSAHVTLAIRFLKPDGSWQTLGNMDLGGQVFGMPGEGNSSQENFHPRGFGDGDPSTSTDPSMLQKIEMCSTNNGQTSCRLPQWAQDPISVPADTKKIQILVVPASDVTGTLEYDIGEVRAFAPIYSTASISAECTAADCGGANSCAPSFQGKTFGSKGSIKTVTSMDAAATSAGNVALELGTAQSAITKTAFGTPQAYTNDASAMSAFSGGTSKCDIAVEVVGPAPTVHVNAKACARDQYGALPGSASACGIEATATNVSYASAMVTVPQTPQEQAAFDWNFTWAKSSCADTFNTTDFVAPAGLQRYATYVPASFETGVAPSVAQAPVTTLNAVDPRPLVLAGGTYACGDFSVQSEKFEGDGDNPVPSEKARQTLFAGNHPELLDSPECLTASLRAEAESLGLPTYAYFEPQAVFAQEVETSQAPGGSECYTYRTESNFTGSQLIAQNVPQGSVPQGCPSVDCYSVYSGVNANSGTSVGLDLAQAQTWGQQELSSSYPRAKFNCSAGASDADCAWINATQTGDAVTVTTKLNVPFYFLGKKTFPLSQTIARTLERTYVQ